MFSQQDEQLLAQPLPVASMAPVVSPIYQNGRGFIEFREAGEKDNPAILFLHGIGSSSAGYRAQLAGLQDRYRVIAWNAPGFGLSTPLADPQPSVNQFVAAAFALLEALGVRQLAAVVGSSWGSVIATALAKTSGDTLGVLVLSAPNVARGYDQPPAQREAERRAALEAGHASFAQPRSVIADRLLAANAAPIVRNLTMELRDAVNPAGWQQAMNMLFSVFTPNELQEVEAHVTLVVGREDKLAPEAAHAAVLRAVVPDMTYICLDDVGHMPKLEAPVYFNDLVHRSILARKHCAER